MTFQEVLDNNLILTGRTFSAFFGNVAGRGMFFYVVDKVDNPGHEVDMVDFTLENAGEIKNILSRVGFSIRFQTDYTYESILTAYLFIRIRNGVDFSAAKVQQLYADRSYADRLQQLLANADDTPICEVMFGEFDKFLL